MKSMRFRPQVFRLLIGGAVGMVFALLAFASWSAGWLDSLERVTLDARFNARFNARLTSTGRHDESPKWQHSPLTVVAVDDRAISAFGAWPWSMEVQGQIIEAIIQLRPAALGIGILYHELDYRDDPAFAKRLQSDVPVVLAAAWRDNRLLYPRLELLAPNVSVGHINLMPDDDGVVRQMPSAIMSSFGTLQPFGELLVAKANIHATTVNLSPARPSGERAYRQLINFRPTEWVTEEEATTPSPKSIAPTISVVDLFDEDAHESIEGKIVVFGTSVPEISGTGGRMTPLRLLGVLPDIFVQAAIVSTIIDNDFIDHPSGHTLLYGLVLLSVFVGLLSFTVRPAIGVLLGPVIAGIVAAFSAWAFLSLDLNIAVTPLILAVLMTSGSGALYRYGELMWRARRTLATFERYVSPEVARTLLMSPDEADMHGGRRQVTVLFADIRGFTSFVESIQPEEVVVILNKYFEVMSEAIHSHEGMIDKYLGDGMMAIFGAPLLTDDHVEKATAAALTILEEITGLVAEGALPLEIGIGLHTGEALVGSVGPWERQEYTAVGDVVNVASRLEQSALPGTIIISSDTYQALPKHLANRFEPGSPLSVKGRLEPVDVYVAYKKGVG